MNEPSQNWAKCYEYGAARIHSPASVDQLRQIVQSSPNVRALGTRHSFNGLPDTEGDLVHLGRMSRPLAIDRERMTVTAEAGIRYGELGAYLEANGFALANLASLPHISVAGACSTATHGSGDRNGNLATSVCGVDLMVADGSIVQLGRNETPETFDGAVVALGALGIAVRVTLDILPTFAVRQDVYEDMPFDEALGHFDETMSSGYSVSLFTDWTAPCFNQVWRKRATSPDDDSPAEPEFFGGRLAAHDLNPIKGSSPENCTTQTGIPGRWNDRLNHFRMEFTPSVGDELQSEYLVPRSRAVEALRAVQLLADQIAPHLYLTEVRSIAADRMWLSTAYARDSVAIHFTWKKEWDAVHDLMPLIEAALAPYEPRPHWGKLFTIVPAVLRERYPRLHDFHSLAKSMDPAGKFRNAFVDGLLRS